jgi:hypothetical protein
MQSRLRFRAACSLLALPVASLLCGPEALPLTATGSLPAATTVCQGDAALPAILDKATAYVTAYVKALSSVVSEERYEQHVTRQVPRGLGPPDRQFSSRTLVSDYLLVQAPGSIEWVPFRDVYSVDGVPVRDRNDRLLKLFLEPSATAAAGVLEIRKESSRYNLGDFTSDINAPTFALQILGAELRGGFAFKLGGRQRVDGADTAVIEYRETARPTMIRGRGLADVPATGWFWVRPETGAILRSSIETRPAGMRTKIEVTYGDDPKLEILVPTEMLERRELVDQVVEGRATYSRLRRFRVETSVEIK